MNACAFAPLRPVAVRFAIAPGPIAPLMDDRALLRQLMAGPVSGDALARVAGQTRAAVWKRIASLRDAGLAIEAQAGRGYRLAQPLDLLDAGTILDALPAATRARVAELEVAWSLDSTNSELLRRSTPVRGASVLLAERQTGGRGRRGREWASPLAAHIYLSVSRQFAGGLARLAGLSLVAGVAAAEALHALGARGVRLKWPNDLVVPDDGALRKLGGLLVEGGGEYAGPARAVIGLGLNVRMPPAAAATIDQPWCDLAALLPPSPSRNHVVTAVLERLLDALDTFEAGGLAPFVARYSALDALSGAPVLVQGEQVRAHGVALGLADDGGLRVRGDDGVERVFHAGEVSVRKEGA